MSDKEHSVFKKLSPIDPEELQLVIDYTNFQMSQPKGYHRRDLKTLLNNFAGEVDRARQWKSKNPKAPQPKEKGVW